MAERAQAQAEAFERERARVAQEQLQAQDAHNARMHEKEDVRLAHDMQSEEWRKVFARQQAAEQAHIASGDNQEKAETTTQHVHAEIARLKAEIEQKKQAAAALRAQAEARRRDAETVGRLWEGRSLVGNAIAA